MRDTLFVKEEIDINDLDDMLWGGAKDRWDDATDDQKERVWDSLMESVNVQMDSTGDIPTKTEVNDFIWFECDDIFNEKDDDDEVDEARNRRCHKENANYNELDITEGTYVLMRDVDRYNDVDYKTKKKAVNDMMNAQDNGEKDMWVGYVENTGSSKRPHLEIIFECGESE